MAVDEAGLGRAATEFEPGDVGWNANMGRLAAWIKQLRLGGMARLSLGGSEVPLPDPAKLDLQKWVQDLFESTGERRAPHPLVQAQGAEPEALGTAAGSPPLQLQQQPAPAPQPPAPQGSTVGEAPEAAVAGSAAGAPQPPAPQGSTVGEAPEAAVAGSAAGAPQPMEVEAPPLLVPPSALHGLDHTQLVAELERVLTAASLDESMVGQLLDRLEGLGLSGQEMQGSGAPPSPPRTCTTHLPAPTPCRPLPCP